MTRDRDKASLPCSAVKSTWENGRMIRDILIDKGKLTLFNGEVHEGKWRNAKRHEVKTSAKKAVF